MRASSVDAQYAVGAHLMLRDPSAQYIVGAHLMFRDSGAQRAVDPT